MAVPEPVNAPEMSVEVRFDVVGWTADQNIENEERVAELRGYVASARRIGLLPIHIAEDLLNEHQLFENVQVDYSSSPAGGAVVSVLAIASGAGAYFAPSRQEDDEQVFRIA